MPMLNEKPARTFNVIDVKTLDKVGTIVAGDPEEADKMVGRGKFVWIYEPTPEMKDFIAKWQKTGKKDHKSFWAALFGFDACFCAKCAYLAKRKGLLESR